jgi:membrane fusion protein, multidrug efflux system
MLKRIIIAIVIVLVVGGALVAIKTLQFKKMIAGAASFQQPPESVSTATVRQEEWQASLRAIGSVSAVQGVNITPDIPGTVREITFESGALVARGDQLVRLDTTSEEAQLRAVVAQLDLARINLQRMQKLRTENTVAQSELDTADFTVRQLDANAENIRTIIEKKVIRAPFDGRLGIRQVNLGQYLEAGRAIVSLQSLAPVYVDFTLPQQELSKLQTGMEVRLRTDSYPEREFAGRLTAINPGLNEATRSVALQATFGNEEQLLRPGMFTRVELMLPGNQSVLVIPATAVVSAPFGDSVYIVEENAGTNGAGGLAVRQQFVRTGQARGDFLTVQTGLKPGQQIVSAGVFKLRNGARITVNNELAPKPEVKPVPTEG